MRQIRKGRPWLDQILVLLRTLGSVVLQTELCLQDHNHSSKLVDPTYSLVLVLFDYVLQEYLPNPRHSVPLLFVPGVFLRKYLLLVDQNKKQHQNCYRSFYQWILTMLRL